MWIAVAFFLVEEEGARVVPLVFKTGKANSSLLSNDADLAVSRRFCLHLGFFNCPCIFHDLQDCLGFYGRIATGIVTRIRAQSVALNRPKIGADKVSCPGTLSDRELKN